MDTTDASDLADLAVPPEVLRYKVHGPGDAADFLDVGRRCRDDIVDALAANGVDLAGTARVLDFGCGCGRTLRWFHDVAASAKSMELHGTDIDEEAINWCREHLPIARYTVNDRLPPLPYADGAFDVVYSISVLTHVDEHDQFAWLKEWSRITKPGGTVVATLHGPDLTKVLPREAIARFEADGFLFYECGFMDDLFPGWYQLTYHSESYVRDRFSRYFRVDDYRQRGLVDHQDIVVLRNGV